jgi:hypothetical protein
MADVCCAECGAHYPRDGDSCESRFDTLLALDHARREPWGSRHGQAFAAFALQHPSAFGSSVDAAWAALYQIYIAGDDPRAVFDALTVRKGTPQPWWDIPPRPECRTSDPMITIADLGDFGAETYPSRLDAWCRDAIAMWG